MKNLKFSLLYLLFSCVIAFTSYLGIRVGYPNLLSPLPLLTTIPVLLFTNYYVAYYLPIVYLAWCFPLAKGQQKIPLRSTILSIILILLSFIFIINCWSYSISQYGLPHTINIIIINVIFAIVLSILFIVNKRIPSFISNLLFHGIFFIWLSWYAFPWLAELP